MLTAERRSVVCIGFSTQIALRLGTSPSTAPRGSESPLDVRILDLDGQIDFKDAGAREAVREYVLEGVYYCRVELRAGAAF